MESDVRPQDARTRRGTSGLSAACLVLLASLAVPSGPAYSQDANALPSGGNVTAGAGAISQSGANMTVTQHSERMAADWNSFNVGSNASVNFAQPSTRAVALNRVLSADPSSIQGRLSANGRVILINPNGVLFGRNAQVDVGGIVASTAALSNEDFMAGRNTFSNAGTGTVVNQGKITAAPDGYVVLAGRTVSNEGVIDAPQGTAALVAGDRITVDVGGTGLLSVSVDAAAVEALAENSGTLQADGGVVLMRVESANTLPGLVIKAGGTIQARSVLQRDGRVFLNAGTHGDIDVTGTIAAHQVDIKAADDIALALASTISASGVAGGVIDVESTNGALQNSGLIDATGATGGGGSIVLTAADSGVVKVSGTVDASARGVAQTGGQVSVTAGTVLVQPTAVVDVSGHSGGGLIQIGGGFKGTGPLRHANLVNVSSGAQLLANAIDVGNGGTIAVWSDGSTKVSGALQSRGGVQGGNGGMLETSGHYLNVSGISIDAASPFGVGGTWLLDPYDMTVSEASTSAPETPVGTWIGGSSTSNISYVDINFALNEGTHVFLQTTGGGVQLGDINVNSPIDKTGGGTTTLTMEAHGGIYINASIESSSGALPITLHSNIGGNGGAVVVGAALTTLGGDVVIGGGDNPLTTPAIGTDLTPTGVRIAAPITTSGASISILGTGYALSGSYGVYLDSALLDADGGNITINGIGGNAGSDAIGILLSGGGLTTAGTGAISLTGTGGNPGGGGGGNYGIYYDGPISHTGGGDITLLGTGGGDGDGSHGISAGGAITGAGNVSVTGYGSVSGSGNGVSLESGSSLITSTGGTVDVTGVGYGSGVPGATYGVWLSAEGAEISSSGLINVTGTNASTAVGNQQIGVGIEAGAAIRRTGTATLTVFGSGGGVGASASNYGVYIAAADGIAVAASGGAINITGVGGGSSGGSGATNYGVLLGGALNGNGAPISIVGTGGISSGINNVGIRNTGSISSTGGVTLLGTGGGTGISANGVNIENGISAVEGNVLITGLASSTGSGSGVILSNTTSIVSATGAGTVTVAGTATGSAAVATYGVQLLNAASAISTVAGLVSVTGTNNSTSDTDGQTGVYVASGAAIRSTGSGGVTVVGTGGGQVSSNVGVRLYGDNGIAATAVGGNSPISITGTGGGGGVAGGNVGIQMAGTFGGNGGLVSLIGTAGNGGGGFNTGVALDDAVTGGGSDINITGAAPANRYAIALASVEMDGGTLTLSANRLVSADALTDGALVLLGAGGSYDLSDVGNSMSLLAADTNDVFYRQAGDLAIDTVGDTVGIQVADTVTVTTTDRLTLNSPVAADGEGDAIVLAAGENFVNTVGDTALSAPNGRWLVFSTSPEGSTEGGLTAVTGADFPRLYNRLYGTTITEPGNHLIYSTQPVLTATADPVSRAYGVDNPDFTSTMTGWVVDDGLTDNATTAGLTGEVVTDSDATATSNVGMYDITLDASPVLSSAGYGLASANGVLTITAAEITISSSAGQTKVYGQDDPSGTSTAYELTAGTLGDNILSGDMGRAVGENVGTYIFSQGTTTVADGNEGNNYSITFDGATNPFAITAAALIGSVVDQTKIYGADDPLLSSVTPILAGLINRAIADINGNSTPVDDTADVSTSVLSLTRDGGDFVGTRDITAATFNVLEGDAATNYSAPTFSGSPTLSISAAPLTVSIADQTKVYGADDPAVSGITPVLAGAIVRTVDTWNGDLEMDDSADVSATLATLTREAGENVGTQGITAASFSPLTGEAAPNYESPTLTLGSILTITAAPLTASIAEQTKVYGADDPALSGITPVLDGVIQDFVATWNGTVVVDDPASVAVTLATLTREAGEDVGSALITAATFNALTGDSAGNYEAPTYTVGASLSITAAPLGASIENQTKVYGADDPLLSSIIATPDGLIDRTVATWNGDVTVDDSESVTTLASLTREADEGVGTHSILSGTFTTSSTNYAAVTFEGTPTLSITAAPLNATIIDQTKIYGADDPALSGIEPVLTGVIARTVTTWNGEVSIDDNDFVSTTLATLTRATGEGVGDREITGATFTALTGNSAAQYAVPLFTVGPVLTITPAPLTAQIVNQTKVYGADDPLLSGITPILTGVIDTTVATWNGNADIDDSTSLSATLASLTRDAGEDVGTPAITAATFNALTGDSAANYDAPTFTADAVLEITVAPVTASIESQTKVYGADDPLLSSITPTVTGLINREVTTWNGDVTVDDSASTTTLATLTREVGEDVGSVDILSGTFNALSASAANYSALTFLGSPLLAITAAPLAVSIGDQTKVYGADDPALSGITPTLDDLINRDVTTWNGDVTVDDSESVAITLASLTREAGEDVDVYTIGEGTFNALTGASAGNYSDPTFNNGYVLTISAAPLTGSIVDQTKVYGADDPLLSTITPVLTGLIDRTVATWNGDVTVDDSSDIATTLVTLTRVAGEDVGTPAVTGATFNALTGEAAGNYGAPTFAGTTILTITAAPLNASIADQTKVYGADDPLLSSITPVLDGLINRDVTTWNGDVTVDDSESTVTLESLTREVGEDVGVVDILSGAFSTLGASEANYSALTLTGSPNLTITPAPLAASIANQSKVYGADDPLLSGITPILAVVINTDIATWNGAVEVDDSGSVATTLTSLTREVGEDVGVPAITGATFTALTGDSAGNYDAPTLTDGSLLQITEAPLTASIADQTKVYGADDPLLSGITPVLDGLINREVATWNGDVTVDDSESTTTLASLTRDLGENVGSRSILSATFSTLDASAANYSALTFTGAPELTITAAPLTASIADQTKVYGADDPLLTTITPALTGLIGRTAATWNGDVNVDDTDSVSTTFTSLTREAGEDVAVRTITAATFAALNGPSAGNYGVPTLSGTPTLTISQASLNAAIENQTKVYGADDPALSGITPLLTGVIERLVATWNGDVEVDDSESVATTLASLTREVGEDVGSPEITAATFTALTGDSAGNYDEPTFTGESLLQITAAPLTASIAGPTKVYGADDPLLSSITPIVAGLINRDVTTWNGDVTVNDSESTTTLETLTRDVGEGVGSRGILSATFTTLDASAANYSAVTFTGSPELTITAAPLTGSIVDQTKVYGADDPLLSGITPVLTGLVNRDVTTWNGDVAVDDSSDVATTLASLARDIGEDVGTRVVTGATFTALTGEAAGNYDVPTFAGSTILTITAAPLTATIADQTKVYGADDPLLSSITPTVTGLINRDVATWNGDVTVDDSESTMALASLTREVSEDVGSVDILSGTFTTLDASAENYSASTFTGTPTLTITAAPLTASIADQTKVYGADDPALSTITPTVTGLINRDVTTWNGDVTVDDSESATTLETLTRDVGEGVGSRDILSATFSALDASAANYSAVTFTGSPELTITAAPLTGSIVDQTKVYGADDPLLSGITPVLTGLVNRDVTTWNGDVAVDDSSDVATTLALLTRDVGEDVGTPAVTGATFTALTGEAAGNYDAPTFAGSTILTITAAPLSAAIPDQTKVYGADDPLLSTITLTVTGLINREVATWNGDVAVDDSESGMTLVSLTREVSEDVGSVDILSGTFTTLGASAENYSASTLTGTPTLTITAAPLTGSIVDQTKVYGADDPLLSGITPVLTGLVNRDVTTWNGDVTVDDSESTTTLASLTREVSEDVGSVDILSGTFTALDASAENYSALTFTGEPTLTITAAPLTASIADQTKVYGADDPLLSSITPIVTGLINRDVTTWNGDVTVDDSESATTLETLARDVGEGVGSRDILSATFSTLSASAANYSAVTFTGSPELTITAAPLTGSIVDQTKVYGADDPLLSGITPVLTGLVNRDVTTWNGDVAVDDSSDVATTLASLARDVGEDVGTPVVTGATFTALTGEAAGNYDVPTFAGSTILTITAAPLTASIADQTKVYGADDPLLSTITPTVTGLINREVATWNGDVTVDDSESTTTLASLTRDVGESVGSVDILSGTFTTLDASAENYSALTFTGEPTLTITAAPLTASIADQTKVYGADDPLLSSITPIVTGLINRDVTTWNGDVSVDDTGSGTTLETLTRDVGEGVGSRGILSATFGTLDASVANYSAVTFMGSPELTITAAPLTGSIVDQTKVYGADDPLLSGITPVLTGLIDRTVSSWNGDVIVDDSSDVATTLATLARDIGEDVGTPAVTGATFTALTGEAAGNYDVPTFAGSTILTITAAPLTASIADQTKVYGADDPLLSTITPTVTGLINREVATWNGDVTVDDSENSTTLETLTRNVGENVGSRDILSATFSTLSASAANYSALTFTGEPTLTITAAPLTASIADQTKVYGADDPALSTITPTLTGLINREVTTWNGDVTVDDSESTTTLETLTRDVGEVVGSRGILSATFSTLDASAANYSAVTFTGSPELTITAAPLTGSIVDQTKVYGADDPLLSTIAPVLTGLIDRTVSSWNGDVVVDDSSDVATTLASLTRDVGEDVGTPAVTGATFTALTGDAAGNYDTPTFAGSTILTITAAPLTASIADQTKVYGADDPLLSTITPVVTGLINRDVTTWNGDVTVDDSESSTTLETLTRDVGEGVGSRDILSATFGTLDASAANYSALTFTGSPELTITAAPLTGSIVDQTKVYGADDPLLSTIAPALTGLIDRTVSSWNGDVVVDDSSDVATTLASLTRDVGEDVGTPAVTGATFTALTGESAGNYDAPTFAGSTILTITAAPLTASIADQTKVYGADDPLLSTITPTVTGLINRDVTTWNGDVTVDDSESTTTLETLTRDVGENVGSRGIVSATFSTLNASAANYSALTFSGEPTLTITAAPLTASITDQTKVYGTDDPLLSGITPTLAGMIDRIVTTWNGDTAVDDSSAVAVTLATLTRDAGEVVGDRAINAATFNALTGTSAGNYAAPTFSGTPSLTVTEASLSASIADQTKVYGADDPTFPGIEVTLTPVNRTVSTWGGNVTVDDTNDVTATVTNLVRDIGEDVGSFDITSATLSAPTGSAAANYSNSAAFTGSPTLAITAAPLIAVIADQTKVYGADDPQLSGITTTLGGVINRTVITWNGEVTVDDSASIATTLATLTREAEEDVGSRAITAATFNGLTGASAANYSAPVFSGSPTLTITAESLTATIANQTKVYGADDPLLSSIPATLSGLVDRIVATWNGNVTVDDSSSVETSLASLTRDAGENTGSRAITAATFTALSGASAANYTAPTFSGEHDLTITAASVTASIDDQTKVYGADDPLLSSITPTLSGLINRTVTTWNGDVSVDDSGDVNSSLTSLTREAGEDVGTWDITSATFGALMGESSGNYIASSLTGEPSLTITTAVTTAGITDQSKVYGADDPLLASITATVAGLINRAISTWNGSVTVDDTGEVTTTLASLTRDAGENVGERAITGATFTTLAGASAGNYSAPTFTGAPVLNITAGTLAAILADQFEVYRNADPVPTADEVTFTPVNRTVSTWGGDVVVNDTGNVDATVTSIVRADGEDVGAYDITGLALSELTGTAAGNYSALATVTSFSTLTITPRGLTIVGISVADKTYDATTMARFLNAELSGVVEGDSVLLVEGTGTFSDKNVGVNKDVSATGFELTGAQGGNYTLTTPVGLTGTITPATLYVAAVTDTKVFDGNTSSLAASTISGLLGTDTAVASQTYDTADIGTDKTLTPAVTINDGNGGGNYSVVLALNNSGIITSDVLPVLDDSLTATFRPVTGNNGNGEADLDGAIPSFMPMEDALDDARVLWMSAAATADVAVIDTVEMAEDGSLRSSGTAPAVSPMAPTGGDTFLTTYSDGSAGTTTILAVDANSIRFTIPNKALRANMAFPLAMDRSIFSQVTVDISGGEVRVTMAGASGMLSNTVGAVATTPLNVSMSGNDGSPLEFSTSFDDGLVLTPRNDTASAIFGSPPDRALLKLLLGQAIVDTLLNPDSEEFSAVRLLR